jgi:hypothetical protein
MATQTPSKKASRESKPKSGSTSKQKSKSRSTSNRRSSSASSKRKSRSASNRQPDSSRSPSSPIAALTSKPKVAGEAVEETAKQAGRKVGQAASKAKVPLVAGGAALAGAAGGIALSSAQSRRHHRLRGLKSKDVVKAARRAGNFGARMGEIAYEVRRARDSSDGQRQSRRSPVEVVLQGLTARRTRD